MGQLAFAVPGRHREPPIAIDTPSQRGIISSVTKMKTARARGMAVGVTAGAGWTAAMDTFAWWEPNADLPTPLP